MDLDLLAELRNRDEVLSAAAEVAGGDPLTAATALRVRGLDPGLAAAALTQATLRRSARAKFGAAADLMFFTRAGLEQATRSVVAERRAARLAAAGVRTLADLGCGLGSDALAAARAGIHVYAVDADPLTAAIAAANVAALGLTDRIEVTCADATTVEVSRYDAVFADPARRKAGRGRVFDPASFSPPWDFVAGLAERVPRTVLKLAPGIDHALLPPGAEGEWVSVGGDLVEAAFWCGPLASVPRRASLVDPRGASLIAPRPAGGPAGERDPGGPPLHELTGSGETNGPVGAVGRWIYDPDPAVVRSHLVAEFAETVGGRLADPEIAYVYADEAVDTPFARRLEVTDVVPFSLKRLRALLRERNVGRLEIRKRGSALEPEQLRRDLKLSGSAAVGLVLTRVAGAPTALVTSHS
ncbi:methyltransferase domain-containing protein [Actinoplanes sp. NBRC 103695]|uniref:class I SAM-dependent methyltransferase n=1 Tax=Actinoplanes sp. NBRC 103695 TaxID=3032202 RepID=UPI0024A4C5B6|nr:methyltransferase domain-containing protein [Actinoplanes sp. NBRC 103695]GLY96370.1 methyltransferase [Actinoplanes sp. NBRC 103695]